MGMSQDPEDKTYHPQKYSKGGVNIQTFRCNQHMQTVPSSEVYMLIHRF